ncbi:MAG: 16S rRNA (cytosine(1402)-N(4))-methyltransferase [Phycisphaerales bacterium]|nr:16S rRNA (cytosine(1402)-N(4))-methyltransferase [Phycisphaerales bacterium]
MADDVSDEAIAHQPVMVHEIVQGLALEMGNTVVDATAGRGGHAQAIAEAIGSSGTLLLMDLDLNNLAFASERVRALPNAPRVIAVHANFSSVAQALRANALCVDAFLADLGFASNQMSDSMRGFSFATAGPLDMRLDQSKGESAQALLARVSEKELADLIFQLGEDPFSRRIARRIIYVRDLGLLKTTSDLAKAVASAYGGKARQSRMHPATRTFMALRIAVNKELESLGAILSVIQHEIASFWPVQSVDFKLQTNQIPASQRPPNDIAIEGVNSGTPHSWLAKNARIAILAFHSLEDRLVKRAFTDWERQGWVTRIGRKPLVASEAECDENPRSRSAKLRTVRIVGI